MMENKAIYNRSEKLKDNLNAFLSRLTNTKARWFDKLTASDLIDLKLALSDVNNVLTLMTTLAVAEWLKSYFDLNEKEYERLTSDINATKPNTNGYDIEINDRHRIIAEVKCIIPINEGNHYGAAQRNAILDDAIKLKRGKKSIKDTSKFIKLICLIDLGENTDKAIEKILTSSLSIRTKEKIRIGRHEIVHDLKVIDGGMSSSDLNTEKIFIKKIKL